jgi:hypothetical protein
VSIATLIVAVRTSGQAGLIRLGAGFTALHARAQAASRTISTSFGPRLTRALNGAERAIQSFGTAVAEVGGQVLSSFARIGPLVIGIAGLIVAAIPAIVDLSGLIALLPPLILAAGAALVVLKLAFKGVGDAISAGLKGDWNKWEKAHKDFPKSAHDFAAAVVIVAASWRKLQKAVQSEFFHGLGAELRHLNDTYLPTLSKWLPRISAEFGEMFRHLSEWLRQPAQVATIEGIFRNLDGILRGLLGTVKPLVQIFLDLAAVAAPRLADMSENLAMSLQRIADHVSALRANGQLGEWVDKARSALNTLIQIFKDLGGVIGAFYTGATADGKPFLEAIREQTKALNEWAHSTDGQAVAAGLAAVGEAIIGVVKIVGFLADFFKQAFLGILYIAVNVFGAILNAAAKAFGWIPGIGPQLKQASAEFQDFRDRVNAMISGIEDHDVQIKVKVTAEISKAAAQFAGDLAGAAKAAGTTSRIQFRARGGPVRAGQPYVVGESRPELFIPGRSGYIDPGTGGMSGAGSGGGGAMQGQLTYVGPRSGGLEALFDKYLNDRLRTGQIKWVAGGSRVQPA